MATLAQPSGGNLQVFLQQSGIPYVAPNSSEFSRLQASFTGRHDATKPGLITLPQNAEHVAAIVRQCVATDTPIVVRGGGHDMFGRFTALGAVTIDLRNLHGVEVAPDKKTARVGGGITAIRVLKDLGEHGLQVPVGNCANVGFVGWCLIGGFGPYAQSYGLGSDQIVGAKVVNAEGKLVVADEDMLRGLRGGGGSLGVVVELTVKVYPKEEVQAGILMFESTDLAKTVTTFLTGYNSLLEEHKPLPSQLYASPFIVVIPGLGPAFTCSFIWNGPESDESHAWVTRVASLAPIMPNTPEPQAAVTNTTAVGWAQIIQGLLTDEVQGRAQTASVSNFSPEVIASIAKAAAALPASGVGGINLHMLSSNSPSCQPGFPDSVCPYREPHIMVELLGLGLDEQSAADSAAWSLSTRNELMGLGDAMQVTYLALTAPEFVDLRAIYGEKLDDLRQLKKKYDPKGVFSNTLPRLD